MLHVALLIICAVAIYVACEWFVNSVEWLGPRLSMGSNAVGSILAAVGTALPESVVTLVAVLWGSKESGDDIGIGSALGGPLVVGTISYAVAGLAIWWFYRGRAREGMATIDTGRVVRDQTWFLGIYVFKIGLGLVAFAIKPWLGLLFFAAYGLYFWREMAADGDDATTEGLEPLIFWGKRAGEPPAWLICAQTLLMLVVIFGASQVFVAQLEWAGPKLGLSAAVVSMLLAPIATELPETLNAFIFTRKGKPQLALANITGSMMIQVTVPSGIGLLGTPWMLDRHLLIAAAATFVSVGYLLVLFRTRRVTPLLMAAAAGFYVAFAVALGMSLS